MGVWTHNDSSGLQSPQSGSNTAVSSIASSSGSGSSSASKFKRVELLEKQLVWEPVVGVGNIRSDEPQRLGGLKWAGWAPSKGTVESAPPSGKLNPASYRHLEGGQLRGLIIREPWIGHILAGRKTWEIRSKPTSVRERIALIRGGSGTIVGAADLVDCLGPFTLDQLRQRPDKHAVPERELAEFLAKYDDRAFAWVLTNVKSMPHPVPYRHPAGAVIWVTLPDDLLTTHD